MIKDMPSPNGTNNAKLFILQGRSNPLGAYDAAPGLESAHASETVAKIFEWAQQNMTPEERLALSEKLQEKSDHTDTTQSTATGNAQTQQPLGQDGRLDARRNAADFLKRMPPKIKIDRWGEQPQVRPTVFSAGVQNGFASRYPDAAKIKRG